MRKSFLAVLSSVGLAAILGAMLVTTPAAVAAPDRAVEQPPGVKECVDYAVAHHIDAWVCWGGLLTYTEERKVEGKIERVPVEFRVAKDTVVVQDTVPEPTNWDTYCEFATRCTEYGSRYVSWTKGNAAYGNSSGNIGNFDVVLRTNLNGRQPRWRTIWYHDSGPGLTFDNVLINCREDNDSFPDSNCGNFGADNGDGDFYLGTASFHSPFIYGNRLNDSNDYYSTLGGYFRATGYSNLWTMSTLRSAQFNCFGTSNDNCYFPGA